MSSFDYNAARRLNDVRSNGERLETDRPEARIGPNAVIQTLRALADLEGPGHRDAIVRQLSIEPMQLAGMVPESLFIALIRAVREQLPASRSDAVLRLAGSYTARYVAAHRIPKLFRGLLARLPTRLGIPLLLAAFRRHAWTFAGSGRFGVEGGYPGTLVLQHCPTCRHGRRHGPAGAYYEAAFEGLLHIVDPGIRVREVRCRSVGDPSCQFAIDANGAARHGETSCVSF
jgi:divinyl protochlorophyllide a 8-vinyl-reductase